MGESMFHENISFGPDGRIVFAGRSWAVVQGYAMAYDWLSTGPDTIRLTAGL